MKSIELIDYSNMKLYCPLCGKLLLEPDEEFKVCEHVLFVAADDGGFAYIKEGVDIDPDPDLNEIGMREYTETLNFENAFKIEMFTPAPSGFGAYYCFQQTK
jgi:hypothetical protein